MLVDDSALVRGIVTDILNKIPRVHVVGAVSNGQEALEQIPRLNPDLIILDVEMPVMDGIQFLKERRKNSIPTPVLMLSVLTQKTAQVTFRALELGAIDIVPKPSGDDGGYGISEVEDILIQRVVGLMMNIQHGSAVADFEKKTRQTEIQKVEYVFIGSSTGGPQALHEVFHHFDENFPVPVIVVQHMPPVFTQAFAGRLDKVSGMEVLEADNHIEVQPGRAIIAKGGMHMAFEASADGKLFTVLDDSPPVMAHKPSIDFSLNSLIEKTGGKVLAVIMTGMGKDGLASMTTLHSLGGLVFAQDEASSVVFGMNRRVVEAGIADRVCSVDELGKAIMEAVETA